METINGEWIMKGLDLEDPSAIHTIDECRDLIHTIGFLPLFSNAIPGFSVEEHVPSVQWWTGDPFTDPWEWRMILAEDDTIAYGKFFNRAAGFISKEWFPTFANYRRNGYDFDALFEDELASYRAKKIMDVFELDEEAVGIQILSSELKTLAGFSKDGGEKNFEGTITDLQMQTYLIFSRFDQKRNKKGQPYGWHLGVMETPETKWGREFVTSSYSEDPKESWKKIKERMHESFPEAGEADIQKLIGIKYPGVENKPERQKKPERKTSRPQELPYPENLITEIGLELVFPESCTYKPLTNDQQIGLIHVLGELKEKEQTALRLRFEEHKTLQETADAFGRSRERLRQIINKGVRLLRHPTRLVYIREGYQGTLDSQKERKEKIRAVADREQKLELLYSISIMECGFSTRTRNALEIEGLHRLGDVAYRMETNPLEMLKIRQFGKGSQLELIKTLEEYGVDCYEGRIAFGFEVKHRETIMELNPSVRLMNILLRSGYDTMEKVKEMVENNPENLFHMDGMGEKTREELFSKLEERGIACRKARAPCNPVEEKIEELVSLGISDRLYNILTYAGFVSVRQIEKQLEQDPWKILRLDGLGKKYREELFQALEGAGIDCSDVREKAAVLGW